MPHEHVPFHHSYSELKAYWTCPAKYAFRLAGAPITPERAKRVFIGTLLMAVAEAFYKERWWKDPDTVYAKGWAFIAAHAKVLADKHQIEWDRSERDDMLQVARDAVVPMFNTVKTERLLGMRNEAELEMTLPVRDSAGATHTVHGRLDFGIVGKDGTLTILDGKGGSSERYVDARQLRLYSIMAPAAFGRTAPPERVGFWFFRLGKVAWKKITQKKRDEVLALTQTAIDGIAGQQFAPAPGTHCRLCDWRLQCDTGQRWLFERAGEGLPMEIPGNCAEVDW